MVRGSPWEIIIVIDDDRLPTHSQGLAAYGTSLVRLGTYILLLGDGCLMACGKAFGVVYIYWHILYPKRDCEHVSRLPLGTPL